MAMYKGYGGISFTIDDITTMSPVPRLPDPENPSGTQKSWFEQMDIYLISDLKHVVSHITVTSRGK